MSISPSNWPGTACGCDDCCSACAYLWCTAARRETRARGSRESGQLSKTLWDSRLERRRGGNIITTGLLDSTLMISYEHLATVDELINQTKSIHAGVNSDAQSLAVEVIERAGHPSPDFLYDEHTVQKMNRDIYYSDYTGRNEVSYKSWYALSHTRVEAILDASTSTAGMSTQINERLEAVLRRIEENLDDLESTSPEWWCYYVQDLS